MRSRSLLPAASIAALLLCGCSIKRMAVNKIGNALASGNSVFETDDDPDLVGEALPFGLKMMESLLAESPKHKGLLMAAASGFTEYAYVYVEQPADRLLTEDLRQSNALRTRARRLYLRAHAYGLRGLEVAHKGFGAALEKDPQSALAVTRRRDVPLLYWTAASHGLAIASSKDDPEMIAQLPVVEAIIRRVLELDEGWNGGAAHEFFISIENSRVGVKPSETQERMKTHFDRALALSKGTRATLFVSYAEAASVATQNRAEFQSLLERALAIDPGAHPEMRLATLVAQHRARWLFSRADELFLEAPATPPAEGQ